MPDRDDMPDPMDEAYVRAEQALDDEAARAARRARVLAAVARDAAAPPAPAPSARRPIRRYGGWLAAAGVAGLSVWTAQQVHRPPPRQQEAAPAPATAPAPSIATAEAPASQAPSSAAPAPSPAPRASSPPPPVMARRQASPLVEPAPAAPQADAAPPPPLPIPPVEKPIAQAPAFAPAPPPPPAPALAAKPNPSTQETVVVTGSRLQRREFAAPATVISGALASKALDGPMRLREAATAGRTADIETLLSQGVPVDAADENGETPLMRSIEAGQREAAALLRRHGASLDQKNRAGVSARDMAATKDDPALDQALDQALRAPVTPSGAAPP